MAALGGSVLTLDQWAKRMDPDGGMADVAELLSKATPLMEDMPFKASNHVTSHRVTQRTGLPTVTRRRLNQGISPSRSTTDQVTETITMYGTRSNVDKKLVDLAGSESAQAGLRFDEAKPHVESLGQQVNDDVWHAAVSDDETMFNGFQTRYTSTSGGTGDNVLLAGASGSDNASIYLVGWGPIHGIFPKNCMAGIDHIDHGIQLVPDSTGITGSMVTAYSDEWCWDVGLAVSDWRYGVRIANVDVYDVLNVSGTQQLTDYGTNILFLMAEAIHHLPSLSNCSPVFYMPRSLYIAFDRQTLARTTDNVFKTVDVDGHPMTTFRGVPVKIDDTLGYAETVVS